MQNTLRNYDMHYVQNNLGKNMDNINNPFGQVKGKQYKLGTNNLEKIVNQYLVKITKDLEYVQGDKVN